MSELTEQDTRTITADAGSAYADLLEDNWERWGVRSESLSSELLDIALMFKDELFIMLKIAMQAGMRKHREKRGIKTGLTAPPGMEAY